MSKRIATTFLAAAAVMVVLAVGAGVGLASGSAKPKVVPIVMGDPGCHWFSVDGAKKANYAAKGATTFKNLDEAALIFKGKAFTKRVAVGKTLTVSKPGSYRITMVGQHHGDNILKLVVS
jgi:hypothetical protein